MLTISDEHTSLGGRRNQRLLYTLLSTVVVVDSVTDMYKPEDFGWCRSILGHSFAPVSCATNDAKLSAVSGLKSWLLHEETQVMFASVLVVFALWWFVRTLLTFFLNLVCPVLVALLAVVCVPQLREPLLGQNYPVVAHHVRNILLKMAESVKT